MDLNFEKAKEKHKNIEIPMELNELVNKSIEKAKKTRRHNKMKRRIQITAATMVLACGTFVAGLNMSPVFAQSMSEIPVIGNIAKVLTFKDFEVNNKYIDVEVRIPEVEGLGDKELETRINEEINNKMEEKLAEMEERAKEYREAYIETGGTEETYRKIQGKMDYELKSATEERLSFLIYHFESLASSYAENHYYNIDLKENKILTLEDVLGENFKEIVDESVKAQIEELKKDEKNSFFEGEMGFNGIDETRKFYINEDGKVVVVFDKYEITPGYMGTPEFVIK